MRQLNFVKDAVLAFNGTQVSDHNRSPLSIEYERLENKVRTQRGVLRKYHRADKRTIGCSWDKLPENDGHTVDYGMGAGELIDFHKATTGAFTVTVTFDTGVTETLTMVFADFSAELLSRKGNVNLYAVNLSLEEV
jgi:hypothetical protein